MFGKIERRMPAVVVLAVIRDAGALRARRSQLRDRVEGLLPFHSPSRTMPTRSCMNSCSSYWI